MISRTHIEADGRSIPRLHQNIPLGGGKTGLGLNGRNERKLPSLEGNAAGAFAICESHRLSTHYTAAFRRRRVRIGVERRLDV
ncbi:hypothetical protein [Methylocystis sp. ATCC 49242]|uniref:hypothetical protein n=1 Tax=Methylocystis sp. ATCC 49242 TaxID=622637 RepID=UPI001FCB7902|nr:hypothetical protein [Methylocystis sp. ATCC 49242]